MLSRYNTNDCIVVHKGVNEGSDAFAVSLSSFAGLRKEDTSRGRYKRAKTQANKGS